MMMMMMTRRRTMLKYCYNKWYENKDKLEEVYNIFKEKFPKEEGYDISVTKYETVGKFINMEREDF